MSSPSSRTVVVTGASSGIGEATAKAFLQRGDRVHAAARRLGRMDGLADAGACVHHLDLADEGSIREFAARILADGPPRVLVNNAGIGVYGAVEEVPLEEARRQFEVNLFGTALLTQLLVPAMREAGGGTIVNLSSIGGLVHTPLGAWYHASKHALEGWSDCLRVELRPFGIRVVVVEPGAVQTEFAEIALAPLLGRAAGGPYESLARRMAAATRRPFESGQASPPSLVADLVVRATHSPHPRHRYLVGHLARPVLWARRLLGSRGYDWMMRRFL
ncbi:MAG TPA: oxidoreductase [Bacteroidia bacterium]|nr:oxidoreductase [Bacteroidia bacterium]